MKTKQVIVMSLLILICSAGISVGLFHFMSRKMVAVDVINLVNAYQMKIDLEAEELTGLKNQQNTIDSLKLVFETKSKGEVDKKEMEKMYYIIAGLEEKLQVNYNESNERINKAVWMKLNPLIDEFAEQNNYELLVGANGMGSVLYMAESKDVTKKIIEFVNSKYDKGK